MSDVLEVGGWYAFAGDPQSMRGRPVLAVAIADDLVLGRWADGGERLFIREEIGDRVPDAVPGIAEPCLICGGSEEVPTIRSGSAGSESGRVVGTKPCPNCQRLS